MHLFRESLLHTLCDELSVCKSVRSVRYVGVRPGRNVENESAVRHVRRNTGLPITNTGKTMGFRSPLAKP